MTAKTREYAPPAKRPRFSSAAARVLTDRNLLTIVFLRTQVFSLEPTRGRAQSVEVVASLMKRQEKEKHSPRRGAHRAFAGFACSRRAPRAHRRDTGAH